MVQGAVQFERFQATTQRSGFDGIGRRGDPADVDVFPHRANDGLPRLFPVIVPGLIP